MAKLTLQSIKSQIADLEAKAARLAETETKVSVGKVKALMAELGVTMEHLGAKISGGAKSTKSAVFSDSKPTKRHRAKRAGAGTIKYRHPKTGATWSGFGRAPGWIAEVKNREQYLVDKTAAVPSKVNAAAAPVKKSAKTVAKKAAGKSKAVAKAAGKRVRKVAEKAAAVNVDPTKRRVSAKTAAKPAAGKATPRKVAKPEAMPTSVATGTVPEVGGAA